MVCLENLLENLEQIVINVNLHFILVRMHKITYFTPCFSVSIVNFEQVNAHWVVPTEMKLDILIQMAVEHVLAQNFKESAKWTA